VKGPLLKKHAILTSCCEDVRKHKEGQGNVYLYFLKKKSSIEKSLCQGKNDGVRKLFLWLSFARIISSKAKKRALYG
jgi:hypothetical protein